MKKKVRFLTDISFSEISGVDKPANDLATVQAIQVAKRADAPELNERLLEDMDATSEEIGILRKAFAWLFSKKEMSGKETNDLPDSAFAYIESGGKKDDEGKTVPRSKRHFPIHDAAHVRNALARMNQSPFGAKAKKKILAAAKKFGIEVSEDKAAGTDDLRKSLYDVGQLAQCVCTIDYLARCSESEREYEGDNSKIPDRLAAVRDELGEILVAMTEEEVGELKDDAGNGGGAVMAMSEKVEGLIKQLREAGLVSDPAATVSKAKMSAANMNNLKMAKGHMAKMAGHLEKASAAHPDDDDISNAAAHHAVAMNYMDKMDVGQPTDATEHGSVEDKSPSEMVHASSKIEELVKAATESLRSDFTKQVEAVKSQLDEAVKKSHTLEVENASLKGELKTLRGLPAPARAMTFSPTGARPMAVAKGAEGAEAAGGSQGEEEIKPGDPNGFTKAFRRAIQNPGSVRDPKFNGSMGKGA